MAEASDRPAPFVASDEFAGARDGYYFRLGEHGLGYYEDVNRGRAPSSLLTEASCSDAHGDTSDADDGVDAGAGEGKADRQRELLEQGILRCPRHAGLGAGARARCARVHRRVPRSLPRTQVRRRCRRAHAPWNDRACR